MAWWKGYAPFRDHEESPLSTRRHDFLVGQGAALEFAAKSIADGKVAMVVGRTGLGKSSIAKHLLRNVDGSRVVLLNAKKHAGDTFALESYLRRPLFRFRRRPTCLLVDEANLLLPTMLDRIFYYYDEAAQERYGIKSLIFFQVDPELRNASLPNRTRIASTHILESLSTQEIIGIVKTRLGLVDVVDEQALCAIILREGHNPRNVLLRLDALLETEGKKIGLADVEKMHDAQPWTATEKESPLSILDESRVSRHNIPFRLSDLQYMIVRHLLLAGQGSVASIADAVGNPYGSVGKQLHLLYKKNIVAKKGAARPVQYFLCQEAKDALMTD